GVRAHAAAAARVAGGGGPDRVAAGGGERLEQLLVLRAGPEVVEQVVDPPRGGVARLGEGVGLRDGAVAERFGGGGEPLRRDRTGQQVAAHGTGHARRFGPADGGGRRV